MRGRRQRDVFAGSAGLATAELAPDSPWMHYPPNSIASTVARRRSLTAAA